VSLKRGEKPLGKVKTMKTGRLLRMMHVGSMAMQEKEDVAEGLRLEDLKDFLQLNWLWLGEEQFSTLLRRPKRKTMYDVCSELIIPATTCSERLVTLQRGDLPRLQAFALGGVFASKSDLTLDPRLGRSVRLGGVEVPTNMTLHGRLCRGGAIRRRYWAQGDERDAQWQTTGLPSRDRSSVKEVAPMPASLPLCPKELAALDDAVGEVEDKVIDVTSLKVGDTLVFRRGVSFVQLNQKNGRFPINSFVSHCWAEETLDFMKTLEQHAEATCQGIRDPGDCVYYISAFNNCQHRVETGWSPQQRALTYLAERCKTDPSESQDAVLLVDSEVSLLHRKWCLFEFWRCMDMDLRLRLFNAEGEIARSSTSTAAKALRAMIPVLDMQAAKCSLKSDADDIHRAVEEFKGGYAAVHAKLRLKFTDMLTFIGSLASSVDPSTGQTANDVNIKIRGSSPNSIRDQPRTAAELAADICGITPGPWSGGRVLLVAPAGSGKSDFCRSLVECALEASESSSASLGPLLPVHVPMKELAKIAADRKVKTANIFDEWARRKFLGESAALIDDMERQKLFILDGFDEAVEQRTTLLAWLRLWLRRHQRAKVLMTTRPSGVVEALSAGVARRPSQGLVDHIDSETNRLGFAIVEEPGSCMIVDGFELGHCFVASSEAGCLVGGTFLAEGSDEDTNLLNLPDATYADVELQTLTGTGRGARAKLVIEDHRVASLSIMRTGSGYSVGDKVSVDSSVLPLLKIDARMAEGPMLEVIEDGTYKDLELRVVREKGSGARATLVVEESRIRSLTVVHSGTGYLPGDEVTVDTSALPHADPHLKWTVVRMRTESKSSSSAGGDVEGDGVIVDEVDASIVQHYPRLQWSGSKLNTSLPDGTYEDLELRVVKEFKGKGAKATAIVEGRRVQSLNISRVGTGYVAGDEVTMEGSAWPCPLLNFCGQSSKTPIPDGTYKGLEIRPAKIGCKGRGATATLVVEGHQVQSLQIEESGFGYAEGDEVTVDTSSLPIEDSFLRWLVVEVKGRVVPLEWTLRSDSVTNYTTFSSDYDGESHIGVSGTAVRVGSSVRELEAREQMVQELGFCDAEVDPIGIKQACAICEGVLASSTASIARTNRMISFEDSLGLGPNENSPDLDVEGCLSVLPNDTWDRPLMATLFGQYIASRVDPTQLQRLSASMAELEIMRFVSAKLVAQAAVAGGVPCEALHLELSRLCYASHAQDMDHIIGPGDLAAELFEKARLGQLLLFEPVQGGSAVIFCHPRISEILAAQEWIRLGEPLMEACRKAWVSVGLRASLRYFLQMALQQQGDPQRLELTSDLIPSQATDLHLLGALAEAIPQVKSLALDFRGCCQLRSLYGLAEVLARLPALGIFTLDLSECHELVNVDALINGLTHLTAMHTFTLNVGECYELGSLDVLLAASLEGFELLSFGETRFKRGFVARRAKW